MSAQDCPAWCDTHPHRYPVTVHKGSVAYAGLTVDLSEWENGRMRMYVDTLDVDDGVSLDAALTLAKALELAAHTIAGSAAGSIRQTDEVSHASWCNDHKAKVDGQDVSEVCRRAVTVGEVTVDLEDSPSLPDDEHRQVVPPDLPDTWVSTASVKDLAAALVEPARFIEEAS